MQQACGAVFLLRIFLKHMLETLEPEDVALQLRGRDAATAGRRSEVLVPEQLGRAVRSS